MRSCPEVSEISPLSSFSLPFTSTRESAGRLPDAGNWAPCWLRPDLGRDTCAGREGSRGGQRGNLSQPLSTSLLGCLAERSPRGLNHRNYFHSVLEVTRVGRVGFLGGSLPSLRWPSSSGVFTVVVFCGCLWPNLPFVQGLLLSWLRAHPEGLFKGSVLGSLRSWWLALQHMGGGAQLGHDTWEALK